MPSVAAQHWSLAIFLIGVLAVSAFMLFVPVWLGGRSRGRAKNDPYESGVVSVGSARLRISAKFYLVAMLFVIFDVEALYLYVWAVNVREIGWLGFVEAVIFIAVLLVGLIYVSRLGVLNWAPKRRQMIKKRVDA